jgi:glycosyltransferase involved in cell wall biosynthesis
MLEGVEIVEVAPRPIQALATYLTGEPLSYRRALSAAVDGFDVVHFHNPSLLGGPGALGLGDGLQLYTTHEQWLLCPTHVLFRYGREVCETPTCWRCTIAHGRPPQLWRSTGLMRRSIARLDLVMSPSRFTAAMHRDRFPGLKVEVVVPPGPDPTVLATLPAGPVHERPYLVFVGRLERIKGARELVEAFRTVRGDLDLVIVGDGAERPALEELARRDPRVVLRGRLPYDQALAHARDARALVVPSVGYETFGGAAVEAMTVGTPAIVRDLGPLPELVESGGGLVATGNEGLVTAMQRMASDEALAGRLGIEAARIACTKFSQSRFLARYLGLVAEAARGRRRERVAEIADAAAGEAV